MTDQELAVARARAALEAAERVAWRLVDRPHSPLLQQAVDRVVRLRAELGQLEELLQ